MMSPDIGAAEPPSTFRHHLLWPSHVLVRPNVLTDPDVNDELAALAREWAGERMNTATPFKYALPGSLMLYRRSPALLALLEKIKEGVAAFVALYGLRLDELAPRYNTFAAAESGGEWTIPHAHLGNQLTCTYYPHVRRAAGDAMAPRFAGHLLFYPPYPAMPDWMVRAERAVFPVRVESGTLVVFPGYLPHSTAPFADRDSEKAALVTNVRFGRAEHTAWRTYEPEADILAFQQGGV